MACEDSVFVNTAFPADNLRVVIVTNLKTSRPPFDETSQHIARFISLHSVRTKRKLLLEYQNV